MTGKRAVIIGAGPAGLTAAWELLRTTDIQPVVIEASSEIGGISRTVNFGGNRIDIGGHRFFSKSDTVMKWWLDVLPLEALKAGDESMLDGLDARISADSPDETDEIMLVRSRTSRILFGGKLFKYPLSLSPDTIFKLGLWKTFIFGLSYLKARVRPIKPEKSLEDYIVNHFGRALFGQFFKEYTEKVWGAPCSEISAEWGAQRIKGLSITKVLVHAAKGLLPRRKSLAQSDVETSLIERFLYPKYGPGHLWECVAKRIEAKGGAVLMQREAVGIEHENGRAVAVMVRDRLTGKVERFPADAVISTMPVKHLVSAMTPAAPAEVKEVADGLVYRDFMTAGLLIDRIELNGGALAHELAAKVPDNWIYIQEPGVNVGRLQIFNNWSPYMVADPGKILIGLEYFVNEGDEIWSLADEKFLDLAVAEMAKLGIVRPEAVADRYVVRCPKAYPAYLGSYDRFDTIRSYTDSFANLFLVGRNGMHRYNNQDHSMLSALAAVDAIREESAAKAPIWDINTEQDYHEAKAKLAVPAQQPAAAPEPRYARAA